VISLRHPTQGQVPIAIVKDYTNHTGHEIVAHVTKTLGDTYLLAGVVSLKQLELLDFPRNGSGKIAKAELEMAFTQKLAARMLKDGDGI
jgi:acyl-coenzyme A synthetase/AMP-(fatty) acid ligase